MMTEEQLKVMADEYAAKFEPMFRKVARFAFILEMARVGHHNRENMDKVYRYMRQLANENANDKVVTFCLDDKDIAHYRLKE